jgi:hypothetical protein
MEMSIQKPVDFDKFRETVKSVGLYWLVINQPPPVMVGHEAATSRSASLFMHAFTNGMSLLPVLETEQF